MPTIIWVAKSGRSGAAGTEAAPLSSIQEAIGRAKADTVIKVKSGVYTENVTFQNTHKGTAGAPIVLMSADGRGAAEIRPADTSRDTIRVNASDYITIDGFKVGGGNANTIHLTSVNNRTDLPTNVTLKNMDITGVVGDGIKVSQGDYINVLNNRISGSSSEEGIDFVGVRHGVIDHNQVSNVGSSGAAIQAKGGSYNVDITYNKVFGNQLYGILAGGWTDANLVRSGLSGNYEAQDMDVVGNEIYSTSRQAMRVVGADDVRIKDNWFHNSASGRIVDVISSGGTHTTWTSGDVSFSNNSFDRSSWLTVDSGNAQPTLLNNRTDGAAPTAWSAITAGITSGEVSAPATPTSPTPPTTTTPTTPTIPTSTTGQKISGTYADNTLTGTSGADEIYGNGGNDVINGKGGNDALYAGSGKDAIVFDTLLSSSNVDRIADFNVADDTIRLDNAVFSKLTATRALSSSFFRIGEKAADSNDHIVYDQGTGALSYDADGSGSGAAVKFASLKAGLGLTAADFFVI